MNKLIEIVPKRVWVITTKFWMLGFIPLNNNSLIIRALTPEKKSVLISVNAPALTPELVNEIHGLETEFKTKVKWVLETDWHHLFARNWAKEFPESTICFPSTRGWRFYEKENWNKIILDRENPMLPEVDLETFQLVPWLGFVNHDSACNNPDEKKRGEFVVYLPDVKLVFIFDILVPLLSIWPFKSKTPKAPMSNFGGRTSGFQVGDKDEISKSTRRLLNLDCEILCFSHGDLDYGGIRRGKEDVQLALKPLETLL